MFTEIKKIIFEFAQFARQYEYQSFAADFSIILDEVNSIEQTPTLKKLQRIIDEIGLEDTEYKLDDILHDLNMNKGKQNDLT
jgi:cell division protein FtsI/penicillin-binding protein 2